MNRFARIFVFVLAALALLPLIAFFTYDAIVFQSHRQEIQAILARAASQDRMAPVRINGYILASHQDGASPAAAVARHLIKRFLPPNGTLRWHLRAALWERLVSLHLTEAEIFGLYSTLAENGQGQGLNALSLRLFGKPLDSLSDSEAATVVAYIWAPNYYASRPVQLLIRRDKLLARVRATQLQR